MYNQSWGLFLLSAHTYYYRSYNALKTMMGYVCQRIIFYADMDNRLHQKRLHLENSPFFLLDFIPSFLDFLTPRIA